MSTPEPPMTDPGDAGRSHLGAHLGQEADTNLGGNLGGTPASVGHAPDPLEAALRVPVSPAKARSLRTPGQIVRSRFLHHVPAMVSLVFLVIVTVVCFSEPLFEQALGTTYSTQAPATEIPYQGASAAHPLGTDDLGRDQFLRLLKGGQVSLLVGYSVAVISTVLGVVVGALAGFYGGWIDKTANGVIDVFLALPILALMLAIAKFVPWLPSGSVLTVVAILSFFGWMLLARVVRGEVLAVKQKDYVAAARAQGAGDLRIIGRHILPNVLGPILVNASLAVAAAILTEATLSYLGFGVSAGITPTWGNMLEGAKDIINLHGHLFWVPALAIISTAVAVNYVGDGLRDAFDPTNVNERG